MAEFSPTALNDAIGAIATAGTFISLHTGDPGTTGASEVAGGTYIRVATTWAGASGGVDTGSQVVINVPASTTITFAGLWTAATGGTYLCGAQLPAPQTYSSAGSYSLTPTLSAAG